MFSQFELIMALQRQQLLNNLMVLQQALLERQSTVPQITSLPSTQNTHSYTSYSSISCESEVGTSEYFSDTSSSLSTSEATSTAAFLATTNKQQIGKNTTKSCSFCPATFKSNTDLARHERIHTGEKPFECCFCHRRFNRKGNMEKHMGTHFKGPEKLKFKSHREPSKQYSCSCGKNFRSRGFYERHQEKCKNPLNCVKTEEHIIDVENDIQ